MFASTSLGILHVQVEAFACRFGTPTGVWCDFRVICEVAALVLGAFDDVYGLCDTDLITGRVFSSPRRGCTPTAISRTPAHDHARGVGRVGSVGRGRAYFCRVTGSSTASHR
jgi:hypothetical protein